MRNLNTLTALLFALLPPWFLWGTAQAADSAATTGTAPLKLTIERMFSSPELDGKNPMKFQFSDDGQTVTYLKGKNENYEILDLWAFDLKTKSSKLLVDSNLLNAAGEKLSEEEKARRERQRISRKGIVEYFLAGDGETVMFPSNGDLYITSLKGKAHLTRLTQTAGAEIDPSFSPENHFVSYVRDQNLYFYDLAEKKEWAVTNEGKGDISYGVAEFVAQEEMDRNTGYWWSKDEKRLALTIVDETPVKMVDRYEIDESKVTVKQQRYPDVGTANASVKLAWVDLADVKNGQPKLHMIPLKTRSNDYYLARVDWTNDGLISYQVQTRDQQYLDLYLYNPTTGEQQKVLTEHESSWVNLHDNLHWLKKSPNFIWSSERSGFQHFYVIDRSGRVVHTLTQGEWIAQELIGVDETDGWVYFSGNKRDPLTNDLYRMPLPASKNTKVGEPLLLSTDDDFHAFKSGGEVKTYVQFSSSPLAPVQVSIHASNGDRLAMISNNEVKAGHPLAPYIAGFSKSEFGSFKSPSGDTLYYEVTKPKNFDSAKKYPLVVIGYGGPHAQMVDKGWSGRNGFLRQILAGKGFVVSTIDNRGSPRRGKKFESAIYKSMGKVEVEDQTAGVQYLIKQGYIDPKKVGFFGWSYGGYLSLMLAMKSPEVFSANVAVAPVTDFSLYDTHYTERYMTTPKQSPKEYARANVINFVDGLQGKLLVIHGMSDDNVLFTNSTLLFKKLQERGKVYESVVYPGSKHGIYGKANQIHVFSTIVDFFERHLLK